MWAVSDRWDAGIRKSHRMLTEVDVLFDRQTIETNVPIVDGSITLDSTAEVRGRLSLELAQPISVKSGPTTTVSPYGYELAVRRGIDYLDGTSEVKPLGVFPVQIDDTDGLTLGTRIDADDRTRLVLDATMEDDLEIVAGTNVATAIQAVIGSGVTGLTYLLPTTPHTVLQGVLPAGSSRWQAAVDMATSVGWDLFFDGIGNLVARPETTFASAPVWNVDDGDKGVLLSIHRRRDRGPAYNRVPVASSSSSAGQVFSAVAIDDDPASPTYYYGPFGRKSAQPWTSEWISSTAMAQDAANGRLARSRGVALSVSFQSLINTALQCNDVVYVRRAVLDIDDPQIVDALTFGLGPGGAMDGRCRTQLEEV